MRYWARALAHPYVAVGGPALSLVPSPFDPSEQSLANQQPARPHLYLVPPPPRDRPAAAGQPWAALFVPAELKPRTLVLLCEALVTTNEEFLRANSWIPNLYQSGAFYALQPEYWLAIPWALERARMGHGLDCKVLAAWRVAELRVRGGEPSARCDWTSYRTPQKLVYHIRVRRADGSIEDPSALLGMKSMSGGSEQNRPALVAGIPARGWPVWNQSPYRSWVR